MTPGERVKEIRKKNGMTLEQFGREVGVTKQTISRIENGINALTDQMILSICREFDINEKWLRTGEGEMSITRTKKQVITDFMSDLIVSEEDSFKQRLIEAFAKLDPEDWEMLAKIAENLTKKS